MAEQIPKNIILLVAVSLILISSINFLFSSQYLIKSIPVTNIESLKSILFGKTLTTLLIDDVTSKYGIIHSEDLSAIASPIL